MYHKSKIISKTALVRVCVIDHKSGPLSHLAEVTVGVVEVPGYQDNHHHETNFNGGGGLVSNSQLRVI